MYHVSKFAAATPDQVAVIFPPNDTAITYGELEEETNRAAHALRKIGLVRGDCIGICITNRPEFLYLMLAAQRSGLHYVLMSTKLSVNDLAYIADDSKASTVILSEGCFASEDLAALQQITADIYLVDIESNQYPDWSELTKHQPASLPSDCSRGREMLYSSGTTGRPKGIRKPLSEGDFDEMDLVNAGAAAAYGFSPESVILSPSPLYHAAPHRFVNAGLHSGATMIIPQRFDAEQSLFAIEKYRCTHSLWVPTMFHRMLKLQASVRARPDLSSHKCAIHGAAPCPVHVKSRMIEWWGPIIDEYYSGSEGIGATNITSQEWLAHQGSVGKPKGCKVHILGPDGETLPAGETGDIYFESDSPLEYWGDAKKTQDIISEQGWRTFGDVGHVDTDGYLYLTDRRHFTIISGGVNIYPQEIEDAFLEHDTVKDVAVIGVPSEEFGQEVKAIIQPVENFDGSLNELAEELRTFIRSKLGPVKTPKSIAFEEDFPRHATGKLYKKELIAKYS